MEYDESMNNKVYDILDRIKNKYGLFFRVKSLYELTVFLSGFECACNEYVKRYIPFDTQFQIFIENQTNAYCSEKHWSGILSENRSEKEAFDLFFEYLEEFKKTVKNPDALEDMYRENMKQVNDWFYKD